MTPAEAEATELPASAGLAATAQQRAPVAPQFVPPVVQGVALDATSSTSADLSDYWAPEVFEEQVFIEETVGGNFDGSSPGASWSDLGVSVGVGMPDAVGGNEAALASTTASAVAEIEVRRLSSEQAAVLSPFGNAIEVRFADDGGNTSAAPEQLSVGFDIDPMQFQGGADVLGRLRLVRHSGCFESDGGLTCELVQPLPSKMDLTTGQLVASMDERVLAPAAAEIMAARSRAGLTSVDLTVDPGLTFVALADGPVSPAGDFRATQVESLSVYEVATYTGSAEATYTVPTPDAAAGPTPSVSFTYSSSSIDGMNSASNNQSGPIGLGWTLMAGGSITRQFGTCNRLADGTAPQDKCPTGPWDDLDEERFSITLNGVSSKLVRVSGNEFRLLNDPMWRVFRRLGQSSHGFDGNESWEVQTPDGTRWLFGTTKKTARNVPVFFQSEFGDRPPGCTVAEDPNRICDMVYQWDLERGVDTLGNTAQFDYLQETNYYNARGLGPSRPYIRASSLRSITYGINESATGGQNAGEANARVIFDWEMRCGDSQNAATCDPTQELYPDVPAQQWCRDADAPCAVNQAPTFWSFLRLGSVKTQIRQDDLSWLTRDAHDLVQYFPETPADSDGTSNPVKMALAEIRQRPNGTDTRSFYQHYAFSPLLGVDFDSSTGSISTTGISGESGFDLVAGDLSDGDELNYDKVWFGGSGVGAAGEIAVRYANGASEGSVEIVVNGSVVATVNLPSTGGFSTYKTVTAPVPGLTGTADLKLRFSGAGSEFARMAWVQFNASEFNQIPSLPAVVYGGNDNWTFLQNRVNGESNLPLKPSMKMPRIKTITNELGARVTFDYRVPPCDIPNPPAWHQNEKSCYPAIEEDSDEFVAWFKYTVEEMLVEPGGSQPAISTKFEYTRPRWAYSNPADECPPGRITTTWNDFRGHNQVRITDPSGVSEYRFFQGMDGDESDCSDLVSLGGPVVDSQGNSFTDSRWLQGQQYEMRRFDLNGVELERETTSYDIDAGPFTAGNERGIFTTAGAGKDAARSIAPAETSSSILIGEDKTKKTEFFYDVHGNVVRELQAGDTATVDDDRIMLMEYAKNTTAWIVQTRCRDTAALASTPDALVSETRWGYDSTRAQSFDAACTAAPTDGLLTNEWSFHTPTAANQSTTEYNARGQAIASTDPRGNTDRMNPDPLHGWLLDETNPLGWQDLYGYDELGHQERITDVNSNVTRLSYDGYDRLSRVWLPEVEGGAPDTPNYAFEYDLDNKPVEVLTKTLFDESRNGDEQYLIVAEYMDGLGRNIQRQSRAQTPGSRWVTSMGYDTAGRLQRESTAYEIVGEPGSGANLPTTSAQWSTVPLHHVYSYDGRNEMIVDRTLGNSAAGTTDWSMSYVFDGWTTQSIDEDGFRTDHHHDAFSNPTQIVEYDAAGQPYATTVHNWDAADRLRSTTDDQGNVVTVGYDLLGRRTELDDPNAGRWLFEYDPNSNLKLQRDGRGVWTGFDYDPIDRVEQRYLSDTDGAVDEIQATYAYDGTVGLDRLRAKTAFTPEGEVVVANEAYDAQGQILAQVTNVPGATGGSFRQEFEWGPGGQQTKLLYPQRNNGATGEVVTTTFDWRTGQPIGLESDVRGVLVSDTRYGADGQERSRSYGPGGADLVETWDIDVRTERTTTYRAGNAGQSSNVIGFGYTYNNRGDTTSISDGVNAGQVQCFDYDAQSRLTEAFTGNNGCTATDTSRGEDPYSESFTYDTIHNLKSNEVKGELVYGENSGGDAGDGPAGPHAVTSTTSGDTYAYDYNGNQIGRQVDGQQLTIRFDAQNQIDRVESVVGAGALALESYLYDADHNRVQRTQNGNVVVYVGETYEWTTVGSDIVPRAPGPDPQVPEGNPDGPGSGPTSISGTVTAADGTPVEGLQVDLFLQADDGSRGQFLSNVATGADGRYEFDVQPDCYRLTFIATEGDTFNGSRWLQASVCVEQGETAVQNAQLDKKVVPSKTEIVGTVTNAGGEPVGGLQVDLFKANADGSRGQFVENTLTDDNGNYGFEVKPGCYSLTFIAPDGDSFESGKWLSIPACVEPGQKVVRDAQLIKKVEPPKTEITGTVTNPKGPVGGVQIDLFEANGDGSRGRFLETTHTDDDGSYRFSVKPRCYVATFVAPHDQRFNGSKWFQVGICVKDGQQFIQNAVLEFYSAPKSVAAADLAASLDRRTDSQTQARTPANVEAGEGELADVGNQLAAEGMTAHYFLGGRRVAVLQSGDLQYTLHDHLNSAAANVGRDGSIELARYRPWGQERTAARSDSLGFGGQRKSDLTGLLDFDSRFYDPGIGRFISPDTSMPDFSDPAALNRYSYVANNPMTYFDPTGEWGLSSIKNAVKKVASTTVAVTKTVAKAASKIDPHAALDIAGMLPDPVGMAADLANAALYLAEGDYKNAAISGLAMLPVVGTGAAVLRKACKMGCDKAVKGVSELADDAARQVSKRADGLPCNSFVPSTAVLMADGTYRAIEEIAVGDFVWAEDPNTGESGGREVVQTIVGSGVKTLVEIKTGGGSVVATEGHPIWVNNEGEWLEAGDVRAGDLLLDSDGVTVAVEQVTSATVTEATVHNFTVEDLHTYFVGAGDSAVLNHNTSCRKMRAVERITGIKPRGSSRQALNAAQGAQAEKIALWTARLRHPLSRVSNVKRKIDTPWGRRFPDIRITSRFSGKTRFWEIKSGGASYSRSQVRKDNWIAQNQGIQTKLRRFGWIRY
ncbi:MAG: carboxypeptidase regulatory-like domain-containing protein [Acidimicrobiales bacterium]